MEISDMENDEIQVWILRFNVWKKALWWESSHNSECFHNLLKTQSKNQPHNIIFQTNKENFPQKLFFFHRFNELFYFISQNLFHLLFQNPFSLHFNSEKTKIPYEKVYELWNKSLMTPHICENFNVICRYDGANTEKKIFFLICI